VTSEHDVAEFIRESTEWRVVKCSPSAYSESWSDRELRHTGLDRYILHHLEKQLVNHDSPQKLVYNGVPDLILFKRKSMDAIFRDDMAKKDIWISPDRKRLEIRGLAKGDFDIIEEIKFLEVKNSSDKLRNNQVEWIEEFYDLFHVEVAKLNLDKIFFYDALEFIDQNDPQPAQKLEVVSE
jgi:hypothetical protein